MIPPIPTVGTVALDTARVHPKNTGILYLNQQTHISQAPDHDGQPSLLYPFNPTPSATERGMENKKPRGPLLRKAAPDVQ